MHFITRHQFQYMPFVILRFSLISLPNRAKSCRSRHIFVVNGTSTRLRRGYRHSRQAPSNLAIFMLLYYQHLMFRAA